MRITFKITCRGFTKWVKSIRAYFILRKETGITKVPSPSLRFRVHSAKDLYTFLEVGKQCAIDIKNALEKNHIKFTEIKNVLDFGCGCGRTLIYITQDAGATNFYGTDIDAEAVAWCKENLKAIKWNVNGALPPLPYESNFFGLVYAISVFTHLDKIHQDQWLDELYRILKPGAILIISVFGRYVWGKSPEGIKEIESKGFVFKHTDFWKKFFPEWYGDAYYTESYIRDKFSPHFKILDYIPQGVGNHQDMVVLQKK